MADFSEWPLSIATHVRGEEVDGDSKISWRVDSDGILHVNHRSEDGDWTTLAFRLVQVKQVWQEVDGG